jgi:hypothetical protein
MGRAGVCQWPVALASPMSKRASAATPNSPTDRTDRILGLLSRDTTSADSAGPVGTAVPGVGLLSWERPQAQVWFNTGAAHVDQDGAIWQGRGLTAATTAGLRYRARYFEMAIRPTAYWAANRPFAPLDVPQQGTDFRNPMVVDRPDDTRIDYPFRLSDQAVFELAPGESYAQAQFRFLSAGVSSSGQRWGPAQHYPLVMSTEASGIPRVFASVHRVPVGIGRASATWQAGRLESSETSPRAPGDRSRLITALVGTFTPAMFDKLELGATRFFHARWGPGGIQSRVLLLPFKGLLKEGNPTGEGGDVEYNQLASVFARLKPAAGVEVYGEYYREDHNATLRDLIAEPDHASAFVLGLGRAWSHGDAARSFSVEFANGRRTILSRLRTFVPPYWHHALTEGHTNQGQALGSSAILGGGGLKARFDDIGPDRAGFVEAEIQHTAQNSEGGTWNGVPTGIWGIRTGISGGPIRNVHPILGVQSGFGSERVFSASLGVLITP